MSNGNNEDTSSGNDKGNSNDLAKLRQEYSSLTLDETQMSSNPIDVFEEWLNEALNAKVNEPNAMCLSTCNIETSMPSSRYVLLKGYDKEGFIWYTNYNSRKGLDLKTNPQASLCFWWPELERSIRIEGHVSQVSSNESDEYFDKRPPQARVGAISSDQSQPIESQNVLQEKFESLQKRYLNDDGNINANESIRRPSHWGGYRLTPIMIEFWKGRASGIHDRIRYTLIQEGTGRTKIEAPDGIEDTVTSKEPTSATPLQPQWKKERLQP